MFSVLMSVYGKDNPTYFHAALKSIYDEQVIKPSEIIVVVDGELGKELRYVLNGFKSRLNDKFIIIDLPKNVGLARALNTGIEHCNYELIARMDSDDISLPRRFKSQLEFMNNNPDVAVCGSYVAEIDGGSEEMLSIRKVPTGFNQIKRFAFYRSPLNHPSVMYRKHIILSVGKYPEFRKSQDFALWSVLLMKGYKLANIPEVLLNMRAGGDMYARRGIEHLRNEISVIKFQYKIGYTSKIQFFFSCLLRLCFRLAPSSIKKLLYSFTRR